MLRRVYEILLRLHPAPFRDRFGEDMLWIFDRTAGLGPRLQSTLDCVVSALRQRTLRRSFQKAAGSVKHAGAPSFDLVETSRSGLQVLLQGAIPASLAFVVAGLILAYGGPSGLIVLPQVIVPSSNAPLSRERDVDARQRNEAAVTTNIALAFAELDLDGDGALSAAEIAPGTAERLRAILLCADLDSDGDIRFAEFLRTVRTGEAACAAGR